MTKENWAEHMMNVIDGKLEGTEDKKLRFFRLGELKRNISRIGQFCARCEGCNQFKQEVEAIAGHIDEAVSVPGQERRELDKLVFRLSNHMMKEHDFFPPHNYNYRYSLIGILAGALAGFLLMKFLPSIKWYLLVTGLIAGLITGQIAGSIRDRKIRNENRLM
jgi:hypothetical protein